MAYELHIEGLERNEAGESAPIPLAAWEQAVSSPAQRSAHAGAQKAISYQFWLQARTNASKTFALMNRNLFNDRHAPGEAIAFTPAPQP